MEPISFTASAPFAICRKICCLWLAILLILCIITYTSIRVFIFTRISFSTTSSKVDLCQLCFSTSELLSSCIVYGNKIIVIVIVIVVVVNVSSQSATTVSTLHQMTPQQGLSALPAPLNSESLVTIGIRASVGSQHRGSLIWSFVYLNKLV